MTKRQKDLVELLKAGPLDTDTLAAKLWPFWRTGRGLIPRAAEGTAFKMCRQLEIAGVLRRAKPNTVIFQLVDPKVTGQLPGQNRG